MCKSALFGTQLTLGKRVNCVPKKNPLIRKSGFRINGFRVWLQVPLCETRLVCKSAFVGLWLLIVRYLVCKSARDLKFGHIESVGYCVPYLEYNGKKMHYADP